MSPAVNVIDPDLSDELGLVCNVTVIVASPLPEIAINVAQLMFFLIP
jgi:hypothetical protein